MYCGGQLRDISEVSEVGVKTIKQFRHLGPFIHLLSSSPSVDHGRIGNTSYVWYIGSYSMSSPGALRHA